MHKSANETGGTFIEAVKESLAGAGMEVRL